MIADKNFIGLHTSCKMNSGPRERHRFGKNAGEEANISRDIKEYTTHKNYTCQWNTKLSYIALINRMHVWQQILTQYLASLRWDICFIYCVYIRFMMKIGLGDENKYFTTPFPLWIFSISTYGVHEIWVCDYGSKNLKTGSKI